MTEVLDPPRTHPVLAELDVLEAAIDRLVGSDLRSVAAPDLLALTGRLLRLQRRAEALTTAAVHEVDVRGAAVEQGATSTAAWLRWAFHLHPGHARRWVKTAQALHGGPACQLVAHVDEVTPPHEGLRSVFAAGDVSAEHVAVVTDTLSQLPDALDVVTRDEAEALLVEEATKHDPKALAHLARHLLHALDPDASDKLSDDEEHQVQTRTFEVRERSDGSSDLDGHLDPELTAVLRAQLSAFSTPDPAVDGAPDRRTAGQRNADALAELLRVAASHDDVPKAHGGRPTVSVHVALETLERRLGSYGAFLDWSGPLSAEAARRLACDAQIIPIVLGSRGEPLDVGRSSYPVTQAIWRALVARDGGCAFAGCDRPPEWTEAHHRTHWADGGETSVANCCLLCDHYHRRVHHDGWSLELVDEVIHTIPPAWVDPDRTPRPNDNRRALATHVMTPRRSDVVDPEPPDPP